MEKEQPIPVYDAFDEMLFIMAKGMLYRDPTVIKDVDYDLEALARGSKDDKKTTS